MEIRAPGRVNLIGEHTDYNDGLVMPVAIDLELRLSVEPARHSTVEIHSVAAGETASFDIGSIGARQGSWIDYVAGVAAQLEAADDALGYRISGFRGELRGNLPVSAGLSSSAALALAAAWALLDAGASGPGGFDAIELAKLCQRAENEYVGVASGLMDQVAVACGTAGHAMLFDCRSLQLRYVALPRDLALVVVDTGSRRQLASSKYNDRREECERGVAALRARGHAVDSLRDVTLDMLNVEKEALHPTLYRRCLHVVEENARVVQAADALAQDDRVALATLFAASHASLRDLYEVSSDELDAAVEIAIATPGVVASRMTGAGFGGCTINLVEPGAVDLLRKALAVDYPQRTGRQATVHHVRAVDGVSYV